MKKLLAFLAFLFALVSVSAFGQAFSNSVVQNSPGNYGRPVAFPQILVCASTDTAVPCTHLASTFTDDTLTTLCTTSATAGQLIGNPSSGVGCNNPGIGDINGNFTIYIASGEYVLCTYSGTWLCQKITQGTGGGIAATQCQGALNGSMGAWLNPQSIGCDNNITTDFHGNLTLQTVQAVAPYNGLLNMITNANGDATFPPLGIDWEAPSVTPPTPFRIRVPNAIPSVGQVLAVGGVVTNTHGSNGTHVNTTWITPSSGITLQTNGTNNSSQTLLNLVAGSNITLNNTSGGNVSITSTGGFASTPLTNPAAPTLANQNAAGARSITYAIVGCQDGTTCSLHSAATSTVNIANANASPQVKLSAYADTLYGYRCYAIYVTADSGGRTLGKIETCAWKNFIDTGGAGDTTTAPVANTTAVFPTPKPLPGCNIEFGGTGDIDHAPCTVNALDDEDTWGDGTIAPGDANDPFWTWVNQNSAACTMTNGMMSCTAPSRATANNFSQLNCLFQPAPSTPYSVKDLQFSIPDSVANSTLMSGVAFRESATGKIVMIGLYSDSAATNIIVSKWTNATTVSSTAFKSVGWVLSQNGVDVGLIADGTNAAYYYSNDGVKYNQAFTETKATFFTTAPDQVGQCIMTSNGVGISDFKYFRVKSAASLP